MYTDLRPDHTRPVEVLIGATWYPGELEAIRTDADGATGWVRWSAGTGQLHLDWIPKDQIRDAA